MLTLVEAVSLIQYAQQNPLRGLWGGYDISQIPFAIYDDVDVVYLNHPNPPKDRPQHLVAATSTEINGIYTATIPIKIVGNDEQTLIPIAYHEGFHVYQQHHFVPIVADFFTAMSRYPELDATYRTLCQLEANVLLAEWSTAKKITFMAHLGRMRRERLAHHDSLLNYERFLERNEGTAHYIEQQARQILYGVAPQLGDIGHGLTRFYQVGAGLCWLISEVDTEWVRRVEAGESLGDILFTLSHVVPDLSELDYAQVEQAQTELCAVAKQAVESRLEALNVKGTLIIKYRGVKPLYRAFNPSTLTSMGDGRVVHRSMFQLIMPKYGKLVSDETTVVDVMDTGELVIEAVPYTYTDRVLHIDTPHIQAILSHIDKRGDSFFCMYEDA